MAIPRAALEGGRPAVIGASRSRPDLCLSLPLHPRAFALHQGAVALAPNRRQAVKGMVYLVHHAEAVRQEVDPQRPLTPAGRAHAERIAAEAAARGVKPAVFWHSGKLRARQTADAFWRACNPLAEMAAVRGLQPNDPPTEIRAVLAAETREVMLVGHMPSLPRLLQALLGRVGDESAASFPQHGLVALEGDGTAWVERWRIG